MKHGFANAHRHVQAQAFQCLNCQYAYIGDHGNVKFCPRCGWTAERKGTIMKNVKNLDNRIDEVQIDEGEFFIDLKAGFCLDLGTPKDFQHCFGARTIKEVREQLKDVRKCECEDCNAIMEQLAMDEIVKARRKEWIGKTLIFKAVTRWSNRKAKRKIVGVDSYGRPLVRFGGYGDFIVREHEVIDIID